MATPAQLGARALRKLGVAIVADADRPDAGPTYTASEVADRAVRDMGIFSGIDERPDALPPVGQDEIAQRALRANGVNPVAVNSVLTTPVTNAEIASRALRRLGVNPAPLSPTNSNAIYTFSQVSAAALRKLGVVASDETPSALDQTVADVHSVAVHDSLSALDYVTWDQNHIPSAVFEFYVVMVAQVMAPEFGKAGNMEAYAAAQEAIRTQALTGTLAQARAEAQVAATHEMLVAEGLADWTLVPSAVAEPYARLVAAALAPMFGRPVEDTGPAMNEVRRYVLSGLRGQALAVAKVRGVHEMLNALGLVTWPVTAVPAAYADDYANLAALELAPVMGRDPGDTDKEMAAVVARLERAGFVRDVTARAVDRVRSAYDQLNAMGVVDFDISAIPASMVDAMADLVTASLKPASDVKDLQDTFKRVRLIAMSGPAGAKLAEQKVRSVHASLDARGMVRWSLYDLPDYAEEPYVLIAASWLAPEVDVKPDPTWEARAERDIRRYTTVRTQYEPVQASYF